MKSQGTTIEVDTTTEGTPDTEVLGIRNYSGLDGEASEIDTTHLKSDAKEFDIGLQDFGGFTLEWLTDYADEGQNSLRDAQASGAKKTIAVTFTDGTVAEFEAFVKNAQRLSGGIDATVDGGATLRITGAVSFTDPV